MMMYEVDLRDRKTGESVETICSTENHDEAYDVAEKYNKENVLNYYTEYSIDKYIDGTDGLIADVFHIENERFLHGVGKF